MLFSCLSLFITLAIKGATAKVARKIAGFMNNAEFDRVDHLVLDTICELTNIIIGKAVTSLNNKGFRFRPSPPCFFMGEKICHGLEAVCISLSTDWGDMRIQAAIKENLGVTAQK